MKKLADIGLIGLAVMGENLVMNMESKGFTVAVFNRTTSKVTDFVEGRAKGKNIIGCYSIQELKDSLSVPLNSKKAVVSRVNTDLESLNLTHAEKYTQIFKRTLSGDIGKNLSLISFPLSEVMEGEKHARLMALVRDSLADDEALDAFFADAAESPARG